MALIETTASVGVGDVGELYGALAGRLDVFFWIYVAINLLYLARGWLGIVLRFGRS